MRTVPVVFRHQGYRFFFYSNEGRPPEPLHIHVRDADGEAKFWLQPAIAVADSEGYDARTLRELAVVIAAHRAEIERSWHEHFS